MNYNKTVLVTGGVGFIGTHVVNKLLEYKFNVIIVDNLSTSKKENLNKNCKFYNLDITSDDIENVFKENSIDIVIHLAAQVSVVNSQKDALYDAEINILGTLNIIKYCKLYNVENIICASTAAVYGEENSCPITETTLTNPLSNYGISKLTMEQYIKNSGINYLILRFSNAYGKGQNQDSGVITIFNELMAKNSDIFIYGNGEQVRDFISVLDISEIICKLIVINKYNKILNISTGNGISINCLFDIMKKLYNYKKLPVYKKARSGDIFISILDNRDLLSILPDYEFRNIDNELKNLIEG